MKRIFSIAAAVLTLGALALSPSTEAQGPIELNIGSLAPDGTPWADMLAKLEQQIERESQGRINVIRRPPGLMAEVELVREARRGERLQACAVTTAAIAEGGNIPLLQIIELPFLFENNAEADHVLDDILWDPISSELSRKGFVLAVWSENGWRSFGTRNKPIRTPADLRDFKMRSQESDVHMAMYRQFGAQAVQKPMTEVLTALQSGVVDGLDNTALYTLTAGLADPLDYFTVTRHIYQPAAVVYSKRWFDALPDDLKTVVKGVRPLAVAGRAAIRADDEAMLALFPESGVEVIELTAAERDAFRQKAREMHRPFAETVEGGTPLLDTIERALAQMRGH